MTSKLFASGDYASVQDRVRDLINTSENLLSSRTLQSPRAVGDALENLIADSFAGLLGEHCGEYSLGFARRAMADLAFKDKAGLYYVVDVKTHRFDTKFNMPNLTSVERIARFYEDDLNYFTLLLVKYHIQDNGVRASEVTFLPIEHLSWDCLTLGALGWGQIQIANSNRIVVDRGISRKQWMLRFCEEMLEFYPKEIAKIGGRISRFEEVREFWRAKPD